MCTYLEGFRRADSFVIDFSAVRGQEVTVKFEDELPQILCNLPSLALDARGNLAGVQGARRVARTQLVERIGVVLKKKEGFIINIKIW